MSMRFHLRFLLFLLLTPPAFGQVVLQKSDDLTDRYIVEFSSTENVAERLRQQRGEAIKVLRLEQAQRIILLKNDMQGTDLKILHDLWIKQAVAISISAEFLERLHALPYVDQVRVDQQYKAEPQGVVMLPLSNELVQDNLARVDIDPLWAAEYRGQGVVIAIMDSGVDVQHDDLSGRWRAGTNSWFDPYGQQPAPKDLTGHGTSVASIVLGGDAGGSYIGVAPNAQWIAARIFDDIGNSTVSDISAALQWVIDPDGDPGTDDFPDIVQNSWGLGGSEGQCFNPFQAELAAIDALGIDQVFAVGNSGLSGPAQGGFSSYLTPAFDNHVISVGALQTTDVLLFQSSRGPNLCDSTIVPALVAPGELIRSAELTFGGFDADNMTVNTGSSFSSPHASGALALLRSKYQATGHLQYRTALFNSAINLGALFDYGRGLLQASAADTLLQNLSVPLRAGEVSFSEAVYVFAETDADASIAVIRSGNIDVAGSVDISSADASATGGSDYAAVVATLDFAAGESSKDVDIQIFEDALGETNESFNLILTHNFNLNLGAKALQVITIKDGDGVSDDEDEVDEIGGGSSGLLELLVFGLLCVGRRFRQ
jgi:subtilisin family serine protease